MTTKRKNIAKHKLPPLEFPIEVSGRLFELRTILNTEITLFIRKNMEKLSSFAERGEPNSDEDLIATTDLFMDVFLRDVSTSNASMQMMLKGDHSGIDWMRDVPITTCVQVAAQWMVEMDRHIKSGAATKDIIAQ